MKNNIRLNNLSEPKIIFEGTAREAIEGFPANVNVSITLSFAGIGIDKTRVQIVADPDCTKTRHEIIAEGAFGSLVHINAVRSQTIVTTFCSEVSFTVSLFGISSS